jgi:hypothetical protein
LLMLARSLREPPYSLCKVYGLRTVQLSNIDISVCYQI